MARRDPPPPGAGFFYQKRLKKREIRDACCGKNWRVVRCAFAHLKTDILTYYPSSHSDEGDNLEWEPNERDAWVTDAQRWISQINGVLQCKIDLDEGGEITGVHVVAGMERDPRHIVRDVEGLLKARLAMDVYYKKIGVVQVLDNGADKESTSDAPGEGAPADSPTPPAGTRTPPAAGAKADAESTSRPAPDLTPPTPAILVAEDLAARVVCGSVGLMTSETTVRAEVELRAGEVEARGLREGPNHADSDMTLVARATVAAVAELIADPVLLHLRDVRLERIGTLEIVLVAVDLVEGRRSTTLFGTCGTSHNRQQAVVYAVLDALNRRLALHGLKTLEAKA